MKIRGTVISGPARGAPLVKHHYYRFINLLGFKPYEGTLDVKLERNLDLDTYATKRIEHVLMNGKKRVDATMCPVRIRKTTKSYKMMDIRDKEKDIINRLDRLRKNAQETLDKIVEEAEPIQEPAYDCWAVQFAREEIMGIVELMAADNIRKKIGLEDGDTVEIEIPGW